VEWRLRSQARHLRLMRHLNLNYLPYYFPNNTVCTSVGTLTGAADIDRENKIETRNLNYEQTSKVSGYRNVGPVLSVSLIA
jgi:hypothetical protein